MAMLRDESLKAAELQGQHLTVVVRARETARDQHATHTTTAQEHRRRAAGHLAKRTEQRRYLDCVSLRQSAAL